MMTEQKLFMIEATNRCKVCESPFVADLVAEVRRLQAERDAYKKAKAENDDRFMGERDAALAERDEARTDVYSLRQMVETWHVRAEAHRQANEATTLALTEARRVLRESQTFIEYARHELQPTLKEFAQFPS